jgi:hypothetical protein
MLLSLITFAIKAITLITYKTSGLKFLAEKFIKKFYLKKESTNSCLLKTCKSSIPSPTPIYFTGILNWSEIPITTPPLAVPSNFVTAREVTSVAAVNCLACSKAFWPVDPSKTNKTSWGASITTFASHALLLSTRSLDLSYYANGLRYR